MQSTYDGERRLKLEKRCYYDILNVMQFNDGHLGVGDRYLVKNLISRGYEFGLDSLESLWGYVQRNFPKFVFPENN